MGTSKGETDRPAWSEKPARSRGRLLQKAQSRGLLDARFAQSTCSGSPGRAQLSFQRHTDHPCKSWAPQSATARECLQLPSSSFSPPPPRPPPSSPSSSLKSKMESITAITSLLAASRPPCSTRCRTIPGGPQTCVGALVQEGDEDLSMTKAGRDGDVFVKALVSL